MPVTNETKTRRDNGEGTAPKQRKDGRWFRQITVEGKKKFIYGKTKAEVNQKFREFKKMLESGTYREIQKQTVEEYMLNWLTTYKRIELKPKSYDTLESTIHHQIIPYFKGMQFFTLTHDDIQKFINKLDGDGYSYSQIKKAYLALNACFKFAMVKEQIIKNPCFEIRLPKKAEKGVKTIDVLTKEQMRAYCRAATEKYGNGKPLYRLGYGLVLILFTGLRLGEALGLRWEDIDFEKQSLKVERTLEYVKNRNATAGEPRYCFVEGSTKTTSGDRTVPLNQTALQALRELQKINGRFPLVFANAAGNPINPRNLNRAHDCILERAGIPHIGIHALRHTFASQLFANKVDIKIVSRLLGHADVGITYNTYIHLLKEELPSATNTLDGILNAG